MNGYWKLGGAALGGFAAVFLLANLGPNEPYKASAASAAGRDAPIAHLGAREVSQVPASSRHRIEAAERAMRIDRAREIMKAREVMERRDRMAMVHLLRGIQAQRVGR